MCDISTPYSNKPQYFNILHPPTVWIGSCYIHSVLRITVSTSDEIIGLKLEGRLAGPWVDELIKTVLQSNGRFQSFVIDVSDLISADQDGENALGWLHRRGARFEGRGPFPEYLSARLEIPLFHQASIDDVHKTPAEPVAPIMPPKATRSRRKR